MSEMFAPSHHQSLNQAQHLPPACGARQLSKLKRFLTTIQHYAADISPDVLQHTRELMLALVNQQFSVEEFHAKLQQGINLPMRPFIIPFLKTNLPLLQRELFYCSQMSRQSPNVFLPCRYQFEKRTNCEELKIVDDHAPDSNNQIEEPVSKLSAKEKATLAEHKSNNSSSLINLSVRNSEYDDTNTSVEILDRRLISAKKIASEILYNDAKCEEDYGNLEKKYKPDFEAGEKYKSDNLVYDVRAGEKDADSSFNEVRSDALIIGGIQEQKNLNTSSKKRKLHEEFNSNLNEKISKFKVSTINVVQTEVENNLVKKYFEVREKIDFVDGDVHQIDLVDGDCHQINTNDHQIINQKSIKDQSNKFNDQYSHIKVLQKEIDMKKIELDRMKQEYKSRITFLNAKNDLI